MFLKILLLGSARVGKSSLLSRFCSGRSFDAGYHETTSPDFNGARVRLQSGVEAVLQIWDLPGNPALLADMPRPAVEYWRDTHVCVLVCDLCSKDSFLALEPLRAQFLQQATERGQADSVSFVLLVNKAEPTHARKQAVFASDVLSWCSHHNIRHFYETSALSDTNVLIALVNITQLAADMDMQRRGVKVACDAQELARQEAKQAATEAAAKAKAKAAADAAEAAARAREEAIRRAEQEAIDAEAKREADFEARWAAQRAEAEATAAKIEAEKAAAIARAKERVDKRKAAVALSAYGQFKQRPHRLSEALIKKHAEAAEQAAATAIGGGGGGATPFDAVDEDGEDHHSPTLLPQLPHRPGSFPPSLHAPPARLAATRPSALGQGTGALLRRLEGASASSTSASASASNERAGGGSGGGSATPASAAGGRANSQQQQQLSARRPSTTTGNNTGGRGSGSGLHSSVSDEDGGRRSGPLSHPLPQPPGGAPSSSTRSKRLVRRHSFAQHSEALGLDGGLDASEADGDEAFSASDPAIARPADSGASNEADDEALLAQPLDPLAEALIDVVSPQVSFTRLELLRLYQPFDGAHEQGLSYSQWRRRAWSIVGQRVPGWLALSERFFAAMDTRSCGRVDFESYALSLACMCGASSATSSNAVDARAKVMFRVCDYAHTPFVATPSDEQGQQDTKHGSVAGQEEEEEEKGGGGGEKQTKDEPVASTAATPVTKQGFLLKQRRELQGRELFAYTMYDSGDDGSTRPNTAAASPTPAQAADASNSSPPFVARPLSDRFITRECVAKVCLQLLQSLPSAQAVMASAPAATLRAAPGLACQQDVARHLRSLVERQVDDWWALAGHSTRFTLSELQWRDAVQRYPHIIQPFAPPTRRQQRSTPHAHA